MLMLTAEDLHALREQMESLRAQADEIEQRLKAFVHGATDAQHPMGRPRKLAVQLSLTDSVWVGLEYVFDTQGPEAARIRLDDVLLHRDGVDLIGFGDSGTQCLRVLKRVG